MFEGDLKKIDLIITVGLQIDESGFLRWYKKHNPRGTIVSINIGCPNYLSDSDFLLQGDAQTIIPEFLKELRV